MHILCQCSKRKSNGNRVLKIFLLDSCNKRYYAIDENKIEPMSLESS